MYSEKKMESHVFYRPMWLGFLLVAHFDVSVVYGQGIFAVETVQRPPLIEIFSWTRMNWAIMNDHTFFSMYGYRYAPRNGIPTGIAIWRDKLFITVPRWKSGVPATLNYVSLHLPREQSPKLIPYPNLARNNDRQCPTGISTVSRIQVDNCNRLWAFDTGIIATRTGILEACRPALKIFDLTTNQLIRSHEVPLTNRPKINFIRHIAVDVGPGGCDDTHVYIAGENLDSLTVYNWKYGTSWKVPIYPTYRSDRSASHTPKRLTYGMTLSPIFFAQERHLYFHPYNGYKEFGIPTSILKSRRTAITSANNYLFETAMLSEYSTSQVMDENGIMYYTLVGHNAVGCRDAERNSYMNPIDVIIKDDLALRFPDDLKVDQGYMWILSNRRQDFTRSRLNYKDVNFRVLLMPLKQAFAGTRCDTQLVSSRYSPKQRLPDQYESYIQNGVYNNQPYAQYQPYASRYPEAVYGI